MVRVLVTMLLAVTLASCGVPRPHPLIVPDPFQTPLPFIAADQNEPLLNSITEVSSVSVAPVSLEGVLPQNFASEVALRAQDLDVPASTIAGTDSAVRLTADVSMTVIDDAARAVEVSIIWQLSDEETGTTQQFETKELAHFANAPLENGLFVPDEWWQAMADRSAESLRDVIDGMPSMAVRYAGSPGGYGPPLVIPAVTGAPGDGNESLTRAVRVLLADSEVNVVDPDQPPEDFDPTEAYTLQGQVALGEVLENGGQIIQISWDLYTHDQRHLGNVAQENLIEPGSLDEAWGEVAVYAALAATDGIIELLGAALPQAEQNP